MSSHGADPPTSRHPPALDRLLPERAGGAGGGTETALKRRSAWSSIFVASLGLAKAGEVRLAQDEAFGMVHVRPATNATG